MKRTLDDIRREGLEALRERLGRAGMLRFLQQFENGNGDYTKDRRKWVDRTSLADFRRRSAAGSSTATPRKASARSRSRRNGRNAA